MELQIGFKHTLNQFCKKRSDFEVAEEVAEKKLSKNSELENNFSNSLFFLLENYVKNLEKHNQS